MALIKEGGLLPEDVSPAAATTQIGFSSLNALSVLALQAGCSRFRNHVGVRQAGLLHFQRVSSRFHGLFRPSFPATRRAPLPRIFPPTAGVDEPRRRRFFSVCRPKTRFLQLLTVFVGSRHPCILPRVTRLPSFHPFLPSFRRVNFDTKNSSSPARQTPETPPFSYSASRQSDQSAPRDNL